MQMQIQKEDIVSTIKSTYKFTDVESATLVKLDMIVEVLVYNLLNNVTHVTKALGVKTIKKAHFVGVLEILKGCVKSKVNNSKQQTGGAIILPSEYFGIDSGRYFADVVSHNTAYLDDLARGPLYVQDAGAGGMSKNTMVSMVHIKTLVEKYKKEHHVDFKMAKDAYELVMESILSNLDKLLKTCAASKQKTLTASLLYKGLNSSGFGYMSCVWKQ